STRQHNEPAGYQEVWHYHLHVFPRYAHDYLYDLTFQRRLTTLEERRPYAEKLKRYFDGKRIEITL
ncbi:MAG: diadenosine tetraphosphate hydrolase, partial [Chloroflexota bacterium]